MCQLMPSVGYPEPVVLPGWGGRACLPVLSGREKGWMQPHAELWQHQHPEALPRANSPGTSSLGEVPSAGGGAAGGDAVPLRRLKARGLQVFAGAEGAGVCSLHSSTAGLPCKARKNNERSRRDLVQAPERNTKALDGNIPLDSSPGDSLLFRFFFFIFFFPPPLPHEIPGLMHPAWGSPAGQIPESPAPTKVAAAALAALAHGCVTLGFGRLKLGAARWPLGCPGSPWAGGRFWGATSWMCARSPPPQRARCSPASSPFPAFHNS